MKVFDDSKSFTDFTEKDFIFSDLIFKLESISEKYFASYKSEFGIKTNELKQFILNYMVCEIGEDENNGDIAVIYVANKKSVNALIKFLENWDLIFVSNHRACISKSNSKEIAKVVNSMLNLCK